MCCTPGKSVVLSLGITLEQALLALNYGLKKQKTPRFRINRKQKIHDKNNTLSRKNVIEYLK